MSQAQRFTFRVYRYDPDEGRQPRFDDYLVDMPPGEQMVLDALIRIKSFIDDSLSFRRSCREGVCGSDGMNINGKNRLACVTRIRELQQPI